MNQTRRNPDRLQDAPDSSAAVLLLIDVINDLEFEGAEVLLPSAMKMAAVLAAFKRRAKEHGIPVIYANDNFGRWRSDFPKLVEHCSREDARAGKSSCNSSLKMTTTLFLSPSTRHFFK